jgi:hypothetical protein
MNGTIKTAEIVATMGVNEFLAHEVQNPLSAAMLALSFVTSAVNETAHISKTISESQFKRMHRSLIQAFISLMNSLEVCLTCIMLPATKQSKLAPTDLKMSWSRCVTFSTSETAELTLLWTVQRIWICRDGLLASQADHLPLSVRNAIKFHSGFIRFRL